RVRGRPDPRRTRARPGADGVPPVARRRRPARARGRRADRRLLRLEPARQLRVGVRLLEAVRDRLRRLPDARARAEGQLLLVPRLHRERPRRAATLADRGCLTVRAVAVAVLLAALSTGGAAGSARADDFVLRPLVTDRADAQLVNPWGLAAEGRGPWWVANEARSSSTLYAGDGRKQHLTVSVRGGPTGVVFNRGHGFEVGHAAPARFVFACEDGMIRAWSPTVPRGWSTEAVVAIDASGSGAVFRGVALARGRLYATDFHNG